MANQKPDYIVKIRSTDTFKDEEGNDKHRQTNIGAAWTTQGGAIFLKADYPLTADLNNLVLVPRKDNEQASTGN